MSEKRWFVRSCKKTQLLTVCEKVKTPHHPHPVLSTSIYLPTVMKKGTELNASSLRNGDRVIVELNDFRKTPVDHVVFEVVSSQPTQATPYKDDYIVYVQAGSDLRGKKLSHAAVQLLNFKHTFKSDAVFFEVNKINIFTYPLRNTCCTFN